MLALKNRILLDLTLKKVLKKEIHYKTNVQYLFNPFHSIEISQYIYYIFVYMYIRSIFRHVF